MAFWASPHSNAKKKIGICLFKSPPQVEKNSIAAFVVRVKRVVLKNIYEIKRRHMSINSAVFGLLPSIKIPKEGKIEKIVLLK